MSRFILLYHLGQIPSTEGHILPRSGTCSKGSETPGGRAIQRSLRLFWWNESRVDSEGSLTTEAVRGRMN